MNNDECALELIRKELIRVDTQNGFVYAKYSHSPAKPIGGENYAGYLRAGFSLSGKGYWIMLHRIVWIAANGLPKKGMTVHHINGTKDDNRLSNLTLISLSENLKESWKNLKRFTITKYQREILDYLWKDGEWCLPKNIKTESNFHKPIVLSNLVKKGLIEKRRREIPRRYALRKPAGCEFRINDKVQGMGRKENGMGRI